MLHNVIYYRSILINYLNFFSICLICLLRSGRERQSKSTNEKANGGSQTNHFFEFELAKRKEMGGLWAAAPLPRHELHFVSSPAVFVTSALLVNLFHSLSAPYASCSPNFFSINQLMNGINKQSINEIHE